MAESFTLFEYWINIMLVTTAKARNTEEELRVKVTFLHRSLHKIGLGPVE